MGDAAQFEELVVALTSDEASIRVPAEEAYASLKSQPDAFISFCMGAIAGSESQLVRQMTAVLLRTDLFGRDEESNMWHMLSPKVQENVKAELLSALEAESIRVVGRGICELIAESYSATQAENGEWADLLPFLFRMASASDPALRVHTLFIFARMCSTENSNMGGLAEQLREIFAQGLNDASSLDVRLMALNATAQFLCALPDSEPEILEYYQPLFSRMLEVVSEALNAGMEGTAMKGIQFFIDIADFSPRFFRPHLDIALGAMLELSTSQELLQQTRQLALEFLTKLAEQASSMMRAHEGFASDAVQVCLAMMVMLENPDGWQEADDEDDEFEVTEADFGEQALDRIAVGLGGEAVLPVVLEILPSLVKNEAWEYRAAGLLALSAVAEGTKDTMMEKLGVIVNSCLAYLFDPHPRVRYSACQLFGQLCIDFTPGFQNTFHEQLMDPLLQVMSDGDNPRTRNYGCAALLNLVQGLHVELLDPYLESIFGGLMAMLDSGGTKVQEQALSCLAVVAERIRDGFEAYYDVFVPLLKQILFNAEGDDFKLLRGKAMEAVSMIGIGVGKERFFDDAVEIMQLMMSIQAQDMSPDDPQARFFMQAWSRMAQILGRDFVPYLETIMPPILEAARIKPEFSLTDADELTDIQVGWQTIVLGSTRVQIRTSTLEDKATACRMLVCLARDLKDAFWDYLDETAQLMVPLLVFYFFDDVRIAAADICPFLLIATVKYIKENGQTDEGMVYLQEMFEYIFTRLLQTIHAEPDIEVLCSLLESLSNSIYAVGEGCMTEEQMDNVSSLSALLLADLERRRVNRNALRDDPDFDAIAAASLDEATVLDELVLRLVIQVNSTVFRTHHGAFYPIFTQNLGDAVMELIQPGRSSADHQWGLCMIDDMVEFAWPEVENEYEMYMTILLEYAKDEDPEVRQAALYGIGAAALTTGEAFAGYIEACLGVIRESCEFDGSRDKDNVDATDNAIAALAKIIAHQNTGGSTDELTAYFVSQLPLTNDVLEGQFVYALVCSMIEENNGAALGEDGSNIPHLVTVLTSILGTRFASEELTPRIVNIITQVRASLPEDAFNAIVAGMEVEHQANIQQIFQ